jgi:hypothetical protein
MTREQKFTAIVDRVKIEGWCNDPMAISIMVIISYLSELQKLGLIDVPYSMTDTGRSVAAICHEFEWTPSDEDILNFVVDLVDEPDRAGIMLIIQRYRDNKETLLEDIKKSKETGT